MLRIKGLTQTYRELHRVTGVVSAKPVRSVVGAVVTAIADDIHLEVEGRTPRPSCTGRPYSLDGPPVGAVR